MRERTKISLYWCWSVLAGAAIGFAGGYGSRCIDTPNPALELVAYRDCMKQAQRCRMTPQDFIRYYELKHQLEDDDGGTGKQ